MADPKRPRLRPGTIATAIWYGACLLGVLLLPRSRPAATDPPSANPLDLPILILGVLLLVAAFVLLHLLFRQVLQTPVPGVQRQPRPAGSQDAGEAFPTPATLITGVWLLFATGATTVGLIWALDPPSWSQGLVSLVGPDSGHAVVMMLAAGIGSLITTMLGYLEHASEKRDFTIAYIPWYVGRPLMGMLLGLIFFFVIKGGLWMTMSPESGAQVKLHKLGLAGIAALVGLFSKNAIAKLRELFQTLFRTEESMLRRTLRRLPADLRSQVEEALKTAPPPSPDPPPPADPEPLK